MESFILKIANIVYEYSFSTFILFAIFYIIIPWILFRNIIKKEEISFSLDKCLFEIFLSKITCSFISILIWWFILTFISILPYKQGFINYEIMFTINTIVIISIYLFFNYKFLNSSLENFIYNEDLRKKILKKFIFIYDIIPTILIYIIFTWISIILYNYFMLT